MMGETFLSAQALLASPLLAVYVFAVTFVFGTVFGSFFHCMAWRISHQESVWKGRSHCAVCGHALSAGDLIPVISYLMRRGRCRYCKERISPRYLAAELVCGAGFVLCVWRWGVGFAALRGIWLFSMLFTLSLVDLEISIIPDRFLLGAILGWAITLPFLPGGILPPLRTGLIGAAALGGGMLLLSLLFDRLTGKESMGGGDIKLYFVCGLYLGLGKGLLCVLLSCLIGLLFAIIQRKGRSTPFPFGPSISIACFVCLLAGDPVVRWYLSLL